MTVISESKAQEMGFVCDLCGKVGLKYMHRRQRRAKAFSHMQRLPKKERVEAYTLQDVWM